MTAAMLEIKDLKKYFPISSGILSRVSGYVKAVDGVSFSIQPGETFGLVGESGCGKTSLGRTILNITPSSGGSVIYQGNPIFDMPAPALRKLRREMQIIFQDPYGSLNPRMTVGRAIGEALEGFGITQGKETQAKVEEVMEVCGLAPFHYRRYPHEFSGGQRQRIGIARALVLNPQFIVADEPVSALDVSIQAQIINLLKQLQQDYGLTYLFISHDLSVVKHICDRVAVMYLGKIVEMTAKDELYLSPLHPYSQALLSAVPVMDPRRVKERIILQGDVPSPANPPKGCRFHTRCPHAMKTCREEEPQLTDVGANHFVACHMVKGG